MDKTKIEQHLNRIIRAANALPIQGEGNAAHIVTICHAAREVWSMVNAEDESTQQRGEDV